MKEASQGGRIFLLVLLTWVSPVRTQEKTASVAGTIVDSGTGQPVARVEVQLLPQSLRTFSDENGRFAFEGLAGGLAVLHTRRAGYSPARVSERKLLGKSGVPVDLIAGQRVKGTRLASTPLLPWNTWTTEKIAAQSSGTDTGLRSLRSVSNRTRPKV